MKIIPLTPETKENILENLLKRSPSQYGEYEERVNQILAKIKEEKDQALFAYTEAFDKVRITKDTIRVSDEEIEEAYGLVDPALIQVIRKSLENIRAYHERQRQNSWFTSSEKGTMLGQKVIPMEKVGVYVPGGKAVYPSSVLMILVPAKTAGVSRIIMTRLRGKTERSIPPPWLRQRRPERMKFTRQEAPRPSPLWLTGQRVSLKWIKS